MADEPVILVTRNVPPNMEARLGPGAALPGRSPAYSGSLTAVLMPEGVDADAFRAVVLERFDMSLGNGLGKVAGRVFRIGHLGDMNDLMLAGTLGGIEMGLQAAGIPFTPGGVTAALAFMAED